VNVCDTLADPHEAREEYGIELVPLDDLPSADAVIVAVAHREFANAPVELFERVLAPGGVIVDVKACLEPAKLAAAGFRFWRL
jgi:UDP-N-acetyl-D-galactosamine dehydrogenase